MILVEMSGRLGNQMFRYAFARWLQIQGGEKDMDLTLDFTFIEQERKKGEMSGWEDSLAHFRTVPYNTVIRSGGSGGSAGSGGSSSSGGSGGSAGSFGSAGPVHSAGSVFDRLSLFEKPLFYLEAAGEKAAARLGPARRLEWKKKFLPWENRHGIYRLFIGYDYDYRWVDKELKIVSGPFECARYPEEIRDKLLAEFTPRREPSPGCQEMLKRIQDCNSVCISVRRGNYLLYPMLDVCSPDYFERAALEMTSRTENPVFFVFSDDVKWARENLRLPGPVFYESGEDPVWDKLRLMYSCRHFIIANSTFSWWAQFLGRAEDKIVIGPDPWFNGPCQPPLRQKNWIVLPASSTVSSSII